MIDIDPRDCTNGLADTEQTVIESLRQQLTHSEMAATAEAKYADGLRQQLAECQAESANWFRKYMEENDALAESHDQAVEDVNHFRTAAAESQLREKVLRDGIVRLHAETPLDDLAHEIVNDLLALPSDAAGVTPNRKIIKGAEKVVTGYEIRIHATDAREVLRLLEEHPGATHSSHDFAAEEWTVTIPFADKDALLACILAGSFLSTDVEVVTVRA